MVLKLSFAIFAAVLIMQMLTWESQAIAVRREAPNEKNASQTIDDAIQSFKTGLDDLVKNIQSNELFRNVSQTLQDFGKSVQQQGRDLVSKIQSDGQTKPGN